MVALELTANQADDQLILKEELGILDEVIQAPDRPFEKNYSKDPTVKENYKNPTIKEKTAKKVNKNPTVKETTAKKVN